MEKPKYIPQKQEVKAQEPGFKHIVRVADVDLPGGKPVIFALAPIKGIGINLATIACLLANVNRQTKLGNLKEEEIKRITEIIRNPGKFGIPIWLFNRRKDFETGEYKHLLTSDLLFTQDNDIKRSKKIKSWVGIRHIRGQPVRGQRTRSHFRKNKGKVVGVKKKAITPAAAGAAPEKGGKK